MLRVLPVLCAVTLLFTQTSNAAVDAFIWFTNIVGESSDPKRPGYCDVSQWSWGIVSPRDHASGLPTGKRQHKPFTITKPIDKASPLLFKACCNGTHIPEVKMELMRPSPTGGMEMYAVITLTDVTVASFQIAGTPDGTRAGETTEYESISLTYQKIEFLYVNGGVEHEDSWRTP